MHFWIILNIILNLLIHYFLKIYNQREKICEIADIAIGRFLESVIRSLLVGGIENEMMWKSSGRDRWKLEIEEWRWIYKENKWTVFFIKEIFEIYRLPEH